MPTLAGPLVTIDSKVADAVNKVYHATEFLGAREGDTVHASVIQETATFTAELLPMLTDLLTQV